MATLVVGGSGKDIGKTAFVCAVISAFAEFNWTAVKITGHDYGSATAQSSPAVQVLEETHAGKGTDTARYLAAGARRALLVSRVGPHVPFEIIGQAISTDRNVIFESNRIIDVIKPDICLALTTGHERKPSFDRLLASAHALINVPPVTLAPLPDGARQFNLHSVDHLSEEFELWLRQQLRL